MSQHWKLIPKNWSQFQHYNKRMPPWIKLHRGLLTDFSFARLPIVSKALAPLLWVLASENKDGVIHASTEEIAFRLHLTQEEVVSGLNPLISAGFFSDASETKEGASKTLAECQQVATPETETERKVSKEERSELRSGEEKTPPMVLKPLSARDQVWGEGADIVMGLSGKMRPQSKALIGRWLKTTKDDAAQLMMILRRAEDCRPVDPISWIEAAVASRLNRKGNAERIAEELGLGSLLDDEWAQPTGAVVQFPDWRIAL
jgi:hypothetical protein